jgi:HAD superfamily hydrolase (TIGR01484 family)
MAIVKFTNKDLIVFDLDGTLTPSKSNMEPDMSHVLTKLLAQKKVAVIGGGNWGQFRKQFLKSFACPKDLLPNLFLFPTTATAFYRYQHGWRKVYEMKLSQRAVAQIRKAFKDVFREVGYIPPRKVYGKVIENRGSQVTFSALGQDVVAQLGKRGLALKEKWKRENLALKLRMAKLLAEKLPELEVRLGGLTSIDITQKGIDKAYGVREIEKTLKIPIKKMLFIGDALYPGGNDAAAKKTGIDCIAVRDPGETKKVIKRILQA